MRYCQLFIECTPFLVVKMATLVGKSAAGELFGQKRLIQKQKAWREYGQAFWHFLDRILLGEQLLGSGAAVTRDDGGNNAEYEEGNGQIPGYLFDEIS